MANEPTYEELVKEIKVLEKELEDSKRKQKEADGIEKRWPALLKSIPNHLVVLDLQGRILYTNGLPDLSQDEAVGKNVYDHIPKEHQYKLRQAIKMALLTGDTQTFELPVVMRDGKTTWWSNSIKPIKRAGQLVEYLSIGTDVSEKKQADEALQRRDAILEALSIALEHVLKMFELEQAGKKILELLGEATGVSRAYIFKNSKGENGDSLTHPIYEWIKSGISRPKRSPELQKKISYKIEGFERWATILGEGKLIQGHVKEFPEKERNTLSLYGIFSIIIVPIFVREKWWGLLDLMR